MQKYLQLLRDIKEFGTNKGPARDALPDTRALFGYQMRYNLAEGFPLITTKKMFFRGIVVELFWFLRGDTNIKYLVDRGVNVWNQDAYNYFSKRFPDVAEHKTMEQFIADVKEGVILGPDYVFGDCGFQYGRVWRDWWAIQEGPEGGVTGGRAIVVDQIKDVIDGIKENPEGRRHMVTAIDPANKTRLALFWCHALFQFNCRRLTHEERSALMTDDGLGNDSELNETERFDLQGVPQYALDCQLYQRSGDTFLGVPFNIASYALLTHIVAELCNMVPGEFIHTFGDVHIYDKHMEAVDLQLSREPMQLPMLQIDYKMIRALKDNGYNFTKNEDVICPESIFLHGYESHPAIKAELFTGLKKEVNG